MKENRSFSKKKYLICDCSRSNQIPETDQITEISPYVHTYFWVAILDKYDKDTVLAREIDMNPKKKQKKIP